MKKLLLFIALIIGGSASAQTTNLLISEYGEGSGGNKKYIEIYNGTGADVDLANYELWKTANGSAWNTSTSGSPTLPFSLTGTLLSGETFVIAHNNTDVLGADLYEGSWIAWNGDDAIGLAWNGGSGTVFTLLDAVGVDGTDPGAGWEVAGIADATKDHILIRKPTVCSPNTNWATAVGTDAATSEWIVSAAVYDNTNMTTDLGMHTANCTSTGCTPTTNTITTNACDSYTLNGTDYTTSGTYTQTLEDANSVGCDSIITLNLTINNSYTGSATKAICAGESYTFGTQVLTAAGTYNATLQTAAGCDSVVSLTLTVNPLPTPTITSTNNVELVSSAATAYQWINCGAGNNEIGGATMMSYTALANGTYSVEVTDANGCVATSACYTVNSVSVSELNASNPIQIYPNPTKGKITIDLNSSETAEVTILNALGKVVYNATMKSNSIDISNFQNGVYMIQVTTSKGNTIQRIVKN